MPQEIDLSRRVPVFFLQYTLPPGLSIIDTHHLPRPFIRTSLYNSSSLATPSCYTRGNLLILNHTHLHVRYTPAARPAPIWFTSPARSRQASLSPTFLSNSQKERSSSNVI